MDVIESFLQQDVEGLVLLSPVVRRDHLARRGVCADSGGRHDGRPRSALRRSACAQGAGLEAFWHKMPTRHLGTDPRGEYVNLLLLPWPLRVRESDFRALAGSVQRLERDPFGFFEFAPAERLDLDLVDRVLIAALDEVDDVVVLPEPGSVSARRARGSSRATGCIRA